MANRPEGMVAIRRQDVPEEYRADGRRVGRAHGGRIEEEPLIVVHGGKTPAGGGGAQYYVLPPEALAPADDDAPSDEPREPRARRARSPAPSPSNSRPSSIGGGASSEPNGRSRKHELLDRRRALRAA